MRQAGKTRLVKRKSIFESTSASHRVFHHYVLAVWTGNFDGRPNGSFIGGTAAAPLFFQIIDSLRASWPEPDKPLPVPPNLKCTKFCSVSGDLPGPHCTDLVEGWFIPGVSPVKTCTVHREVLVDVATGLRLPVDDGRRQNRHEVYDFWPGNLLSLFQRADVARRLPPPFLPGTLAEFAARSGNPPRIISPSHDSEILLASATSIPLRAKADADVRDVY
jgi:penicillin-binding protein 1C